MTTPPADAHQRLEAAALGLFVEQGYPDTTVLDIVQRAGVARRTFFRYFPTKRDVLFWGQSVLEDAHAAAVAAAPGGSTPLELAGAALSAAADIMAPRAALIRRRQAVITANEELQERELLKRSQLSRALAARLVERGVDLLTASVTAEAALGAYGIAFRAWAGGAERDLHLAVDAALDGLRAMTGSFAPTLRNELGVTEGT